MTDGKTTRAEDEFFGASTERSDHHYRQDHQASTPGPKARSIIQAILIPIVLGIGGWAVSLEASQATMVEQIRGLTEKIAALEQADKDQRKTAAEFQAAMNQKTVDNRTQLATLTERVRGTNAALDEVRGYVLDMLRAPRL